MVTCSGESGAGLANRPEHEDALLYGAGDAKIGSIIGKGKVAGKGLKKRFFARLPALGSLIEAVGKAAERGYLVGLDGRRITVRSPHSALNSLLQGAGAIVMKQALVDFDRGMQERGLSPRVNYALVASVHDEYQVETDKDKGTLVGKALVRAITQAGEDFELRCKLDAEYSIGCNWGETH